MMQIKQQIKSPLYRNSIFLIANIAVRTSSGLFFWMVVARFYAEAEVGLGAAVISAISLLVLFSRLGLGLALVRFLPKAEKPVEMINSCLTLSGIVALAVAGIFLAGLDLWSPALGFIRENAMFILAFVLLTFGSTLSQIVDFIFIAKRRAELTLAKNTIMSLLRIPLPILLALFFGVFGIVSSWGIAIGVALAVSLFLFLPRVQNRYRLRPTVNLAIIKDMRRFSTANYFASLFIGAPTFVLPLMVVNLLGAEQNAYFYVAWMIAALLFAISTAVSQSLFAEGSHFEDELGADVRRSLKFILLLSIPAIIVLLLLGKWLLLLFGASYSANALTLLWILALSSIPLGINRVYMTILRVRGRMTQLVAISGFPTLAALTASYLIVPTTGIVGVGYVWIAAQGIVSLYVAFAMRLGYARKPFQPQ